MNFTRVIKNVSHKQLWCDDAFPASIDEFIGNEDLCKSLYNSLGTLHSSLLLVGPHGCGKTTFTRLLARKLLGEYYKSNLLELYSSINRNKNYIGNKLLIDNKNIDDFIHKCSGSLKLKLIIVYDIDTASYDTQNIFCELLKQKNVILILTANTTQTLQENLLASLMTINMSYLKYDEILDTLCVIEKEKNMSIDNDVKRVICIICNGDLKKLFNIMQLLSGISDVINVDVFYKLVDMPSYECIKDLLLCCQDHNTELAFKKINDILSNGYDILDILDIIEKTLLYIDILYPSFDKNKQTEMLSTVTQCIIFKNHTVIQLYNMICEITSIV